MALFCTIGYFSFAFLRLLRQRIILPALRIPPDKNIDHDGHDKILNPVGLGLPAASHIQNTVLRRLCDILVMIVIAFTSEPVNDFIDERFLPQRPLGGLHVNYGGVYSLA